MAGGCGAELGALIPWRAKPGRHWKAAEADDRALFYSWRKEEEEDRVGIRPNRPARRLG
jgi:hypothetical protein